MKMLSSEHSIELMAKVFKVSRSGYYAALKRPESTRSMKDRQILKEIKSIHAESRKTYGSPRVYQELKKTELACGLNKVAKMMKNNDIYSIVKKKHKPYGTAKHNPELVSDNIVSREFFVAQPNQKWVSDITYVWTNEGWLYVCVIIDLFSRAIIGWSMDKNVDTNLVIMALTMAVTNRQPKKGVIFHSDRGCQYTSHKFHRELKRLNMISSMSRKGNCWDNACSESFFHTLKTELIYQTKYSTRNSARMAIFEYITVFYNRKRIHSYLDYMSPMEFEKKHSA